MTADLFEGRKSGDPALIDAAVALAAVTGDSELYGRMLVVLQKAAVDPGLEEEVLHTLPNFISPPLVLRTLEYATSGLVRNQDSASMIAELLAQPETRSLSWDWVRAHWPEVQAQLTTNSGSHIVAATGTFCSADKRDEVSSFFAAHPVEASDQALSKALQSIDDCIRLRTVQAPNLHRWLDAHAPSAP
jgi:aminopeptidase N/puromycin-sensitive aminopeptidase